MLLLSRSQHRPLGFVVPAPILSNFFTSKHGPKVIIPAPKALPNLTGRIQSIRSPKRINMNSPNSPNTNSNPNSNPNTTNNSPQAPTPIPTAVQVDQSYQPKRILLWSAAVLYFYTLFINPTSPGQSALDITNWKEAWDLSYNFWFVMPALDAWTHGGVGYVPVIHPGLEALFNLIVSWGLLSFGFISDDRSVNVDKSEDLEEDTKEQKIKMFPFVIATAFLTNMTFLPYLALRKPNPYPTTLDPNRAEDRLYRYAESKSFPVVLGLVGLACLYWFVAGRPDYVPVDLGMRIETMKQLCFQEDRLAFSFLVDACVFWGLQGWLLDDDMKRRKYEDPTTRSIARYVPFFGPIYYLLKRPTLIQGNITKG